MEDGLQSAQTTPIHSFIFKVAELCNLNCAYCYMYNAGDTTYLSRPKVMAHAVVAASVSRIAEHAATMERPSVNIIFHGGEPLLAGKPWFEQTLAMTSALSAAGIEVEYSVQTNGTLLDESWIELFRRHGVGVGLSMDGPEHIHDRVRVNHAGKGSYRDVRRALELLQSADDIFGGVLCVVDPQHDGMEVYHHFRELDVRRLAFLLPLAYNWDKPPPAAATPTPFADYLIPIFDEWFAEDDPTIQVRTFAEIIGLIYGARSHIDAFGGDPVDLAVIESDGSLQPLDALRACANGLTELGLNVLRGPVADIYDNPVFAAALAGKAGLAEDCRRCELRDICGGGYLPNRYSRERAFDNRNVLCADLYALITHVVGAVHARMFAPA